MKFVGKDLNGDVIDEWIVYSIGGGASRMVLMDSRSWALKMSMT